MKQEFFGKAVLAITEYPENYKAFVRNLEEEGLQPIGYIRKSKGEEKDDVWVRLLEVMANRLRERFEIKTVYASPFSESMDEIASRDLCKKSRSLLSQLDNVSGSIQDMLNHINTVDTDVCLIVINFAGLSRDCEDIRSFFRSHPRLRKILIDLLSVNNTVKSFTKEDILGNHKFMEYFQCRKSPVKRSL
ncbi:hypothetical protein CLU79DRAFT_755070 [Phycomyces nitens]|nr:hypothetical protein CLU79DRAFT_755070 [Phycomyces nitens]